MSNILEVRNIRVEYRTARPINYRELFKKAKNRQTKEANFCAIDDVSFEIQKGDILGIIGANGAGKSTLLRAIANIYSPDKGKIVRNYKKDSLLSLGIGFQTRLSGRENIYLSGLALGFTYNEILEMEEEIINFSKLHEFIDKPVKTYSSGMYSKLSFSISVMLNCDLLLIDEVLSVGDTRFRKKSFNKLREVILDEAQTVIIVSHSENSLRKLCNKILWLDKGKVRLFGDTNKIINEYQVHMNN